MSEASVELRSPAPRPWLAVRMLAWRELIRFFRQPNRLIGAIGQPVVFWLLFGSGLEGSFRLGESDQTAREYLFPGMLLLLVLFTAIFTSISVIEDRKEGFLQSVLVAPLPRWAMVLGKLLGSTAIALVQGLLFLLLALTLDIEWNLLGLLGLVLMTALAALAMTALGFVLAWQLDSTQGFHAVMSLVLMPLWLLSGAFFPIPAVTENTSLSQTALPWVMRPERRTDPVAGVRQLLYGEQPAFLSSAAGENGFWSPGLMWCWLLTAAFTAAMFLAATRVAATRTQGDLQ